MSKKMMKRSLALGALMAFVITGSAMAATTSIINADEYENGNVGKIVKASAGEEVQVIGNKIQVNGVNIDKTYYPAKDWAIVTLGDENTEEITINNSYAIDVNYNGAKVEVKGKKLNITVDGNGVGIYARNGTAKGSGNPDKDGSINDNGQIYIGENTFTSIVVNKNGYSGTGIYVQSEGVVDINGDLVVTAGKGFGDALKVTAGYVDINKNKNIDKKVQLTGNITFSYVDYPIDSVVNINLTNKDSWIDGNITVANAKNATADELKVTGMTLGLSNGAYWQTKMGATNNFVNTLNFDDGIIIQRNDRDIAINKLNGNGNIVFDGKNGKGGIKVDSGSGILNLSDLNINSDVLKGLTIDEVNTKFNEVADKLRVKDEAKDIEAKVVMAEGNVKGETTGMVSYDVEDDGDGYFHGYVAENTITEKINTKSDAVSDAGMALKGHWRAHMNDMNKRMGELRNANGEAGVWTRMVRGESEYQGAKMQYNQYQLGYDEKLSVDKRWVVGAAVTFSEGDASYGQGSTEDKSTAFAIYGSKLNNDGTFVDLIARYAHLESDLDDRVYGAGDYSTNGMSVSAEFGKRIQQGNGLWIEPQVELTYGSVDGASVTFADGNTANYDSIDSFIARAGFALGKDIKHGNVYARASYLYDFDGETETQFAGGKAITEDFGGGWWEVGVGANINLSKATYIYADVEKTFGGEVDTNWQWNLGIRYSF